MYIKIHRSYRIVVAICDKELAGKKFEQGKLQLDVRENFYKGEIFNFEKAVELMQKQAREDATYNIVGKNSVKAAIEAGIITKEGAGKIAGVPYALKLL